MKKGGWLWMQGWCYNEDVFRFADELRVVLIIFSRSQPLEKES
jgi:hypothetical protein